MDGFTYKTTGVWTRLFRVCDQRG